MDSCILTLQTLPRRLNIIFLKPDFSLFIHKYLLVEITVVNYIIVGTRTRCLIFILERFHCKYYFNSLTRGNYYFVTWEYLDIFLKWNLLYNYWYFSLIQTMTTFGDGSKIDWSNQIFKLLLQKSYNKLWQLKYLY